MKLADPTQGKKHWPEEVVPFHEGVEGEQRRGCRSQKWGPPLTAPAAAIKVTNSTLPLGKGKPFSILISNEYTRTRYCPMSTYRTRFRDQLIVGSQLGILVLDAF